MLKIDGSIGEGGGQIIRTSVAMSAITGEPIKITNIRANRPNPGLGAQHFSAVDAAAKLCDAKVSGLKIGSKEVVFKPDSLKGRKLNIDVGTAGSVTLILQALMIPATYLDGEIIINIRGGTDVRWSPPIDYLRFVTLPILRKFGYIGEVVLLKRGFYPKGGGKIKVKIKGIKKLKKINLNNRGYFKGICGISHAHTNLKKAEVAKRQMKSARPLLFNELSKLIDKNTNFDFDFDLNFIKIKQEYPDTLSYGSGITLWAEFENTIIGADSLGERGKRAEIVGYEAAQNLIKEINSGGCVDKYMADQVIPYIALSGDSVKVSEITKHARTNVKIVNKFGFDVKIEGNVIFGD